VYLCVRWLFVVSVFYYADFIIVSCPLQVTLKTVKQLQQSKQIFENQLRELECRLEQEAKVVLSCFHTSEKIMKLFIALDVMSLLYAVGWSFHTVNGQSATRKAFSKFVLLDNKFLSDNYISHES